MGPSIRHLTEKNQQERGEEGSQAASSLPVKFSPTINQEDQVISSKQISTRLHTSTHNRSLNRSSRGLEALLLNMHSPTLRSPDLPT